jgi:putative transcriptional regulator
MADERSDLGLALEEGLREALAWKRGEIALEVVNAALMPAERVKAIRRKAARSAKAFERRFGISAATVQNWEQGRRQPDPTARLLLKVIEADADFVEHIAKSA